MVIEVVVNLHFFQHVLDTLFDGKASFQTEDISTDDG